MVVLAVAGYLTVADDFRHVGELAGVSALLVAGLALVGDAYHVMAHWLSLRWIAVGVVAGTAIGGAADVAATGFVAGVAAGAVLALIRARSVEPV
jgi:hypothetical protein